MRNSVKTHWWIAALFAAGVIGLATHASAQSAYRCDEGGKVTYSDKPCAQGRAVAPIKDTPEQRAASKEASDQMRKDQADLNKRLSDREKLEAQERAAALKAAKKAKADDAKRAKGSNGKSTKAKSPKKAAAPKAPGKAKVADNRVYSDVK
jgi:hypothetical protein